LVNIIKKIPSLSNLSFSSRVLFSLCNDFIRSACAIIIEEKLNAFEQKCLRKITNTHWRESKSNRTLGEETKQGLVSAFIKRRRWKYLGHVFRTNKEKLPWQELNWTPVATRRRGRPRETLRRNIINESENINVNT
jgi:hypothetical protein